MCKGARRVGITFLHLDKLVKRYGKPSPHAGLNAYYQYVIRLIGQTLRHAIPLRQVYCVLSVQSKPAPMGKETAVRLTDEVEKYPIKKVIQCLIT